LFYCRCTYLSVIRRNRPDVIPSCLIACLRRRCVCRLCRHRHQTVVVITVTSTTITTTNTISTSVQSFALLHPLRPFLECFICKFCTHSRWSGSLYSFSREPVYVQPHWFELIWTTFLKFIGLWTSMRAWITCISFTLSAYRRPQYCPRACVLKTFRYWTIFWDRRFDACEYTQAQLWSSLKNTSVLGKKLVSIILMKSLVAADSPHCCRHVCFRDPERAF